jgi:glutamate-5-semialdehyde dehydrogenase
MQHIDKMIKYNKLQTEVDEVTALLENARVASKSIGQASIETRNAILVSIADLLICNTDLILAKNKLDVESMDSSDPKLDRLILDKDRVKNLADATLDIIQLDDPTGNVTYSKILENELQIEKRTVALGVVGTIYESRPNVTVDIAVLCVKSGNAVVLRGGTDAYNTNTILVAIMKQALRRNGMKEDIITLFPTERSLLNVLLTATRYVDVIIPRGSAALIQYVREHSKIPTIETGAGVCHTYISSKADLTKAAAIVVNAKVSRPSVCNSLDTIIVDSAVVAELCALIAPKLQEYGVEIFADEKSHMYLSQLNYPNLRVAQEEDFGREFLDFKCSIKTVDGIQAALTHIERYSSRHSEAIVSEDIDEQLLFINEVDAAAVYTNASTRFTDGGVFGLGAEIGISTQKLHARGPFALEKLVTEKWVVRGNGQVR